MAIPVEMHDGTRLEFPDGTDPAVIQRTVKSLLAKRSGSQGNAAPAEAQGAMRGLLSVMQGPSLGFSDEIIGAIAAPVKTAVNRRPLVENYREVRDFARGAAEREARDNPIFTTVTRAAAAAPLSLIGRAAPAATALQATGQAAKVGAVTGGIAGVGGSNAEDLQTQALDGLKGAALSSALAGASVPVSRAVGSVYGNVAARVNESAAARYAREKVAEALARDARGTVAEANPLAALGQASARLARLGDEGRVVDASGQNARQLLDTLATLPGRTKSAAEAAIVSRQAGRADRLRGAADSSLNANGARLSTTIDSLLEKRSADAKPLYDSLYKQGVFVNDELRGIIDAANKLGAGSEAKRIATAKQLEYGLEPSAKWAGMRELDYLKQGLDDVIAANKNEFGKLTKVGAAVQSLKNDLVSILDQQTKGLYKEARNAYAGPSALIDAAKEGRKALSQDDASITKMMQGLTEGEKEAFRLGAFETLRSKLGTMSGQNEIMRMWRDKTTGEKLKAVFGDERAFREFASTAAAELRMKGLESVGRGSQTAARQYGAGDLDVPAVADAVQSVSGSGNPLGVLSTAMRAWNRVQTPEAARDQMGRILLSQGTAGRNELAALLDSVNSVAAQRAAVARSLGLSATPVSQNALAALMAQP